MALIDSAKLHGLVPRFVKPALLRRVGVDVGDLAPWAPSHGVEVDFVKCLGLWEGGGEADALPGVFFPVFEDVSTC